MPSLVIRPASIIDVPSIVEIRVGALTEDELSGFVVHGESLYSSVKKLRDEWDTENRLKNGIEVFVAENMEQVNGFIVYNMDDPDDNIDNLVVAKQEQGKGIGRALVKYIERLAKSRGFDIVTTDTTENAQGVPWKAYGFWKRLGYEDTGERLPTNFDFKVIPLTKRLV
jgi:ribosomal protein S18 acetylase RimI-like enzyme